MPPVHRSPHDHLGRDRTLVTRLEVALKRLETGNTEFPGACTACLQGVATAGHLVALPGRALEEVRAWRVGSTAQLGR